MTISSAFRASLIALLLAGCASTVAVAPTTSVPPAWTSTVAEYRPVGLGLPGGAQLSDEVTFAGGLQLVVEDTSPLRSLSDFKLIDAAEFVTVSDAGDLGRGRLMLDDAGRLVGLEGLRHRRLTLEDGAPILEKADGDAEGLTLTDTGDLLVSFERKHRIWNYGRLEALDRPRPVSSPGFAFTANDGMEGLSARNGGWRVAGESGGVWDCAPSGCHAVTTPPAEPALDNDYRITGMDRDPSGEGFFVVQRSFSPPIDARARVRRMDGSGALGPVLVELKLPGTTDNFEGIAAIARGGGTRLYLLSDDNNNAAQRTLLLAFDVRPFR